MKRLLLLVLALAAMASPAWGGGLLIGSGVSSSTASYTDDFERASLGTNWSTTNSYSGSLTIYDSSNIGGQFTGARSAMYYNAATFSNNQFSRVTYVVVNDLGPALRCQSTEKSQYYLKVGTTYIEIHKVLTGTDTTLGTANGLTIGEGSVVEIRASGTSTTTISARLDGSEVISRDDSSSPVQNGKPGISSYNVVGRSSVWVGGDL